MQELTNLQKKYNLKLKEDKKRERKEKESIIKKHRRHSKARKIKGGFKCGKCKIPIFENKSGLCIKCLKEKRKQLRENGND